MTANAAEMNFSVQIVPPENQINQEVGYFDLRMKPGQTQTVQVMLKNATGKEVVVEVHANTATTNNEGHVEYSSSNSEYDASLMYPFSALVHTEDEVTIEPNSTYMLDVKIQMPEESFDGMILGGLYFIEKEADGEGNADASSAVQVKNRFSYIIGVKLSETDVTVAPELVLNKVYASQINNQNIMKVHLQNPTATVIENVKVNAIIYTKDGTNILHETNKEGLMIAPNSNFDYGISWGKQAFQSGTYRVEVTAKSGDQQWEWTEYVTIDREEAEALNHEAVNLEGSQNRVWLWVALCGGTAIMMAIYMRRKKKG